jgi:hypothetical protein
MNETISIEIVYIAGKRKGQIISWSNIPEEDIIDILDDLTRDQISNAEIMLITGDERIYYEDFLYRHYTQQSANKRA